ncbi:unnamed protein product, partial [Iphiclides podalirius]
MKLSVYLLICGGIMIFSPQINGDVVVDLFGKIQESAQKLGDDIKVVFQSNNKRNQQYKYEAVKESKPAGEVQLLGLHRRGGGPGPRLINGGPCGERLSEKKR